MKNITTASLFILFLFTTGKASAQSLRAIFERANARSQVHSFDQGRLVWVHLPPEKLEKPKGTILISPGRTESWLNWTEFSSRLAEAGYHVALMEHRGQGRSARFFEKSDKGHIDRFETYVNDFNQFVREVQKAELPKPHQVLANSMGGAIALLADTSSVERIILNAPMFQIQTKPFPLPVAKILSKLFVQVGLGDLYAFGTGPYKAKPFSENTFASSKIRYEFDSGLYQENPEKAIGGPTLQWVHEATRVEDLLRKKLSQIHNPVLLFQAEDERFVLNEKQSEFCQQLKHCRLRPVPRAMHVLHMEEDENFQLIVSESLRFLQRKETCYSSGSGSKTSAATEPCKPM